MYNSDNIARVRRDEAAARERELAEEERQQEEDGARRLAILRGEAPPPLEPSRDSQGATDDGERPRHDRHRERDGDGRYDGRERKKRKRHGEDDTDFEMRVAREMVSGQTRPRSEDTEGTGAMKPYKSSDAPLTDASGHIDLFGEATSSIPDKRKNPEAEAEKERKKREYEDQYRMRFSSAAGPQAAATGPWYAPTSSTRDQDTAGRDAKVDQGTDAFGRPDPGRKDRDATRIEASDPLAMMKRGAAKARQVEKERRSANEEREKELRRLRREERRSEKKRRRRGDDEGDASDDLEGFSLDKDTRRHEEHDQERRHRHRHRHHHQHRHRSPQKTSHREKSESRHHQRDHDRGHDHDHNRAIQRP